MLGPVLAILGTAALFGFVTLAAGTLGVALAAITLLVGLVFVVTGFTQKCPLNRVLGLNTYRTKTEAEEAAVGPGRMA